MIEKDKDMFLGKLVADTTGLEAQIDRLLVKTDRLQSGLRPTRTRTRDLLLCVLLGVLLTVAAFGARAGFDEFAKLQRRVTYIEDFLSHITGSQQSPHASGLRRM